MARMRVIDRTAPRLAGDVYRAWVASGLGLVVFLAVLVVWAYVNIRTGQFPSTDQTYLFGLLTSVVIIFNVYTVLTWLTFRRAGHSELHSWAKATAPKRRWVLWVSGGGAGSWSAQAAVFAMGAVLLMIFQPALRASVPLIILGMLLVGSSWLLVVVSYAISYLREDADNGGLEFPGAARPVWSDYLYLAIQVSTTFSTSDVTVVTTKMRRQVSVHSVIAFVFNTVIVALLVSALLTIPS